MVSCGIRWGESGGLFPETELQHGDTMAAEEVHHDVYG